MLGLEKRDPSVGMPAAYPLVVPWCSVNVRRTVFQGASATVRGSSRLRFSYFPLLRPVFGPIIPPVPSVSERILCAHPCAGILSTPGGGKNFTHLRFTSLHTCIIYSYIWKFHQFHQFISISSPSSIFHSYKETLDLKREKKFSSERVALVVVTRDWSAVKFFFNYRKTCSSSLSILRSQEQNLYVAILLIKSINIEKTKSRNKKRERKIRDETKFINSFEKSLI